MKLTFLGTSAAWPSARRNNVCFVAHSRRPVLFECGPSILHQLAVAHIEPADIRSIIISHIHGDHALGLPMFLIAAQISNRTDPLTVCLPASAVQPAVQLCLAVYPSLEGIIDSLVQWIAVPEQGSFETGLPGEVRLRTMPADHVVPVISSRLEFQPERRTLAFSGDTAYCERVAENANAAELLIHESNWSASLATETGHGHSTAADAGSIAALARARRLALVHTSRELAGHERELAAEAAVSFKGEILVPPDYMTIEL